MAPMRNTPSCNHNAFQTTSDESQSQAVKIGLEQNRGAEMNSDLERALAKLRFDEQVLGYSLMTKAGRPFVSFSFPNELFPRVRDSINLYKTDLRLMTIDTDRGLVVLSPVDLNWILTVLYVPELQLGLAIAKTKNVLRLLEGIELPPPPEEFEESAESNLKVLESIAMQAASTSSEMPSPQPIVTEPIISVEPTPPPIQEVVVRPPEAFNVQPSTVPKRGPAYAAALTLDSDLYKEMKQMHRNFGFDVLMLVDGSLSVAQVADSMFQPNERVIDLLKWAASKNIVGVPLCEESIVVSEATMGRFVKCPKFIGDLSKIDGRDVEILRLCDGTKTTEEIAEMAGVQNSKVIQIIARNKKYGIKMIGKTI
nr:MAG: hypothetical protein AM324_07840 [Candidatus Thorarchaeota archaeon SMTZ1-83]